MWLPYGQENVHELRKSLKDGCPGVLGNVNLKISRQTCKYTLQFFLPKVLIAKAHNRLFS